MRGELGGLCDSSELGTRLASVKCQSPEFYSRVQLTMFQQLLEEVRAQVHLARIFFQEPPSSRYVYIPYQSRCLPPVSLPSGGTGNGHREQAATRPNQV